MDPPEDNRPPLAHDVRDFVFVAEEKINFAE
jgi:hypothetical protein